MSTEQTNQNNMPNDISDGQILQDLFLILKTKYPYLPGERSRAYMNRLLIERQSQGAETNSLLYVETEIMLLFHLDNNLRQLRRTSPDNSDIQEGLDNVRTTIHEQIDKWVDLQE